MKIKRQILLLSALIVFTIFSCNEKKQLTTTNQEIVHKPWKEQKQEYIWTTSTPDFELIKGTESYKDGMVYDVSKPTITIYKPIKNNTDTTGFLLIITSIPHKIEIREIRSRVSTL